MMRREMVRFRLPLELGGLYFARLIIELSAPFLPARLHAALPGLNSDGQLATTVLALVHDAVTASHELGNTATGATPTDSSEQLARVRNRLLGLGRLATELADRTVLGPRVLDLTEAALRAVTPDHPCHPVLLVRVDDCRNVPPRVWLTTFVASW